MKVSVSKELLVSALRKVLNVVSTRTTLPILNNILLEGNGDKLIITGTDLEVTIRTEIPVTVTEPGSITVLARKFGQIISMLPDGEVTLATDANQQTSISCKKSFFKIIGIDSGEFPRENIGEGGWSFTVPLVEFRKVLGKVAYSASPDETRRVLNGILLSLRNGVLTTVATDGRRLALIEKAITGEMPSEGDVILPPKVVVEIQKLTDEEGNLTVLLSDRRVAFKTQNTLITSKLVDGNYPNYRQVIPPSFSSSVVIPREEFMTVLNRVSLVVSETSASVRAKLEKAQITICANSTEFGESNEPMDVSYEGKTIQIAFNPAFLMDPLKHLECDQLVIQFNDEYSPISISGDEGFLYIIMPMRV